MNSQLRGFGRKPSAGRRRVAGWCACVLLGVAAVVGAALTSCGPAGVGARKPGALRVVVTVAPLAGLVRPLVPPDATVTTLMAPGRSEHGYELTARDVGDLATADMVVYVGLNLEPRVAGFLKDRPSARRIDVCWSDELGLGAVPGPDHPASGAGAHEEEDDDGHHHGPIDQHLWLDPGLVRRMVPILADKVRAACTVAGVSAAPPSPEPLLARIDAVDAAYRERLKPLAGRSIVTHHAAWDRLAERYGLRVAAVLRPIEGAEPSPGQIDACVQAVRTAAVKTIFVEPQFNAEGARRIAEATGVKLGVLDPLGDGDWFALMQKNLDALVDGLGD